MFSAFRMSLAGSGRGLCEFNILYSPEKYQKNGKSLNGGIKPSKPFNLNWKLRNIRSYLAGPGILNFL